MHPAQVRAKYVTVQLPEELIERVDAFLQDSNWGYRSRAEVVAHATREFLLRYTGHAAETGEPLETDNKPAPRPRPRK
jgi:metal-responsive CopG/Arc/MetJ family transcriptional regulator